MQKPRISIVVAIGKNRELGKDNQLLWHIPEDMKRFKTLTLGHPVIMGRKTFESILSILGKPLPGRTNIVVTRDPSALQEKLAQFASDSFIVTSSLEEALAKAREIDDEEIHIGGGAELYNQALPFADRLYLTLVDDTQDADTFFPEYESAFTKQVGEKEEHEQEGLKYTWVTLER